MKYVLQDLLNVRIHRQDSAEQEKMRCKRAVELAEKALEQRKQELVDYTAWRIAEEERRYQQVLRQQIHRSDLDDLHVDLQELRTREDQYRERILAAEKALQDAITALAQANAAYQDALKKRQKLEEHRSIWTAEQLAEQDLAAEKELEDFRVRKMEAGEDDADDVQDADWDEDRSFAAGELV